MRFPVIIFFSFFFLFLHAGGNNYSAPNLFPRPDTVPPPPNGTPSPLTGPTSACVGDVSVYAIDVPVGCICQWSVNGNIQPESGSPFILTWTQSGLQVVSVVFLCANGQISDPLFINVLVLYQPNVFLGNDTTILQGQTLLLDAGNPGSDYLWSTGETTQTLPVSVSGTYAVNVSNFCGADADTIEVSVFVGITESMNSSGCFDLTLQARKINFINLPQGTIKIQVTNLSGIVCYDGPLVGEINVAHPGIYLIRVISSEITCYKKVFIP